MSELSYHNETLDFLQRLENLCEDAKKEVKTEEQFITKCYDLQKAFFEEELEDKKYPLDFIKISYKKIFLDIYFHNNRSVI